MTNLDHMGNFYTKYLGNKGTSINKVILKDLELLKGLGISLETFLSYIGDRHNLLFHGSVFPLNGETLVSTNNKIYASSNPAIAIMRSLYSNRGVVLGYPYFISEKEPLKLVIHTRKDLEYPKVDKGYIYIVSKSSSFINVPAGSWQYTSNEPFLEVLGVIETSISDFSYEVSVIGDYEEYMKHCR